MLPWPALVRLEGAAAWLGLPAFSMAAACAKPADAARDFYLNPDFLAKKVGTKGYRDVLVTLVSLCHRSDGPCKYE